MKIITGKWKRAAAVSIVILATLGGLAALPAGAGDAGGDTAANDRLLEIVDEVRQIATSDDTGSLSEEQIIAIWELQRERGSLCDSLSGSESTDLC